MCVSPTAWVKHIHNFTYSMEKFLKEKKTIRIIKMILLLTTQLLCAILPVVNISYLNMVEGLAASTLLPSGEKLSNDIPPPPHRLKGTQGALDTPSQT